jgi:hypothetical protein
MARCLTLLLAAFALAGHLPAAPSSLDPSVERVRQQMLPVLQKAYRDTDQAGKGPVWNAWARTQVYYTTPYFVDNRAIPQPQKETGPRPDGFMVSVRCVKNPAADGLSMPQLIEKEHWTVLIDRIDLPKEHLRLELEFAYGPKTDPEFVADVRRTWDTMRRILLAP